MNNWEPCKRCGSNKVQTIGKAPLIILGLLCLSFGLFLLIIPPVGILMMIIGIVSLIVSPFAKKTMRCQDCKLTWKVSKQKEKAL